MSCSRVACVTGSTCYYGEWICSDGTGCGLSTCVLGENQYCNKTTGCQDCSTQPDKRCAVFVNATEPSYNKHDVVGFERVRNSEMSQSDILTNANNFKVFLDTDIEIIDKVSYAGTAYHVVKYNNRLPYASGIEIFSSDGSQVTDSGTAKSILTSVAWKEAAAQLKPSDIDTLRDILDASEKNS
ncbi:hypothetical protein CW714_10215 [Methanophagales archaeon]|nr:MAG: hypothetical protein CW714_10215 [Methanophagales archaeon]